MLTKPMDILSAFPVRKSRKQKQLFQNAVQNYVSHLDYDCTIEKGSLGARNIVIGDPETARFLITAHYDTCARLPFPNLITPKNLLLFIIYQLLLTAAIFAAAAFVGIGTGLLLKSAEVGGTVGYLCVWAMLILMLIGPANRHNANDNTSGVVTVLEIARSMPQNLRDKVCFVLFDLEEAGLIGSASYHKAHKAAAKNQVVLNLDCVGDGDEIVFFPTGKLRKRTDLMQWLEKGCGRFGKKRIDLHRKGFGIYPSDQGQFPLGVGIAAFRRSKWAGLYLGRIHTGRDTVLEETNINILRACLITLVGSAAK